MPFYCFKPVLLCFASLRDDFTISYYHTIIGIELKDCIIKVQTDTTTNLFCKNIAKKKIIKDPKMIEYGEYLLKILQMEK